MIITQENFLERYKKIQNSEKNIWQSPEWGIFQWSIGKKVFSIWNENYLSLVVKQDLWFGQNFLHVQRWPIWQTDDDFFIDLKKLAAQEKSAFIRISQKDEKNQWEEIFYNWKKFSAIWDIFPKFSLLVDLTKSEDEILMEMKQKWRYNIRLAQRKWVKIFEEKKSEKAAEIFYNLSIETTKRDWFSGHSKEVYQAMIESLWEKVKVYIWYFKDEPICAWIFTFEWEIAIYYYWVSSNLHRNLMAPYFLQWNAIVEAKKMWFKKYDFLWIAWDEKNKSDPWYWITNFKMKFWWEKVEYFEAFDIPVSYFKYFLYRLKKFLKI